MLDRGMRYYPALKAAVPFAAGILLADIFDLTTASLLPPLAAAALLLAITIRRDVHLRWLAILILLAAAGALIYATRVDRTVERLAGARIGDADLVGRIVAESVARRGLCRLVVDVDSIVHRRFVIRPSWRVQVSLGDSTIAGRLRLGPGDRIVVRGTLVLPGPPRNPGEPDQRSILRARGLAGWFQAFGRAPVLLIGREGASGLAVVEAMRRVARRFADRHVRGEEGDIVRALLFGERERIDDETIDLFRRTGTIHILSVSGLHVGVIALGLFVFVSWIPDRRVQLLVFTATIALYTVVAGGGASILRASMMAVAAMTARTASRIDRPLNTLGLAALLILAFQPDELFNAGFQLSFASVGGILLLYGRLRVLGGRLMPRRLRGHAVTAAGAVPRMLLLSFCAQAFTAPLLAHHFGYIALSGALANLVAVPLTSIALGASAAGAAVMPFSDAMASWLGGAAYLALRGAEWSVRCCAGLPASGLTLRPPSAPAAALISAALLYAALAPGAWRGLARSVACVSATVAILLVDRLLDPLAGSDARSLALLSCRGSTVVATLDEAGHLRARALRYKPEDSAATAFALEGLRRRLGIAEAVMNASGGAGEYLAIGGEMLHRRLPLVVSAVAGEGPAMVRAGAARMLRVPLGGEIEEGAVLHFNRDWESIRWH